MTFEMPYFLRVAARQLRSRAFLMAAMVLAFPAGAIALILGVWEAALLILIAIQGLSGLALLDIRTHMATATQTRRESEIRTKQLLQGIRDSGSQLSESLVRQDEELCSVRDSLTHVAHRFENFEKRTEASLLPHQTRQVEAIVQLFNRVTPRAPMPPTGGWALDASGVLALIDLVEKHRPQTILELGSGTSSVWMGYALETLGEGAVISVDHDQRYAEITRAQIAKHGLESHVEVRLAPLRSVDIPGHDAQWYDDSKFGDIKDIDLLVIDGPPQSTGDYARYPALPLLIEKFANHAHIVLDDASRADEQAIARRWCEECPSIALSDECAGTSLLALRYTKG